MIYSKSILITGGAGYIGTNILALLLQNNYKVFVVDNFSNSKKEHIQLLKQKYDDRLQIFEFDLLDKKKLDDFFGSQKFDVVIHLAGKKYVQESFLMPKEYKKQNIAMTKLLLKTMQKHGVKNLVFSSSVTVYGNCKTIPASENTKHLPLSPYAKNKSKCEKIIKKWQKNGNNATILRLSNPIGANCELYLGDDCLNKKYMGVLPYIIENVKAGNALKFNGNNHPTKDGTTVRDYIHVLDVANAFCLAAKKCKGFNVYNIGYGQNGFSVLDILGQVETSLNKKANYSFGQAKKGDMSVYISDTTKAKNSLGFCTKFGLDDMVKSQIDFMNKNF